MQNNAVSPGFISIDEAIKLIESDTRENPVVDIKFLMRGLPYLRQDGNYNIKKLKRAENGKIVRNGSEYVQIATKWDKDSLEHAILEKYRELTGRAVDPETIGVTNLTTAFDDDEKNARKVRVNKNPMTKFGESTEGGYKEVGGNNE